MIIQLGMQAYNSTYSHVHRAKWSHLNNVMYEPMLDHYIDECLAGIKNQYQIWYQRTYPTITKIVIPGNERPLLTDEPGVYEKQLARVLRLQGNYRLF